VVTLPENLLPALVWATFLLPLAAIALLFLLSRHERWLHRITGATAVLLLLFSVGMILRQHEPPYDFCFGDFPLPFALPILGRVSLFYVDNLSIYFIFLVNVVSLLATASIPRYLNHLRQLTHTHPPAEDFARANFWFHVAFNAFHLSMVLVAMMGNLILLWMMIEVTTLVSGYLVGFRRDPVSLEAAWKYIMITSAGILFALLGTLLLVLAIPALSLLNLPQLLTHSFETAQANPELVKLSFLFILVGYGTKAGLAPMHTWLPDGHGQAPYPISAMLSGVLLKSALYAVLRFQTITQLYAKQSPAPILLAIGLFSLLAAAFFIIKPNPFKRLLAYHSLEHMGIITFALGLGTPQAVFLALFHAFSHALTKALLFLVYGRIQTAFTLHVAEPARQLWEWAVVRLGYPDKDKNHQPAAIKIERNWITNAELAAVTASETPQNRSQNPDEPADAFLLSCLNRDEISAQLNNEQLHRLSESELSLLSNGSNHFAEFSRMYPPGFCYTLAANQRDVLESGQVQNPTGAFSWMPASSFVLALVGLALVGVPPFSIFISETLILFAGISAGNLPAPVKLVAVTVYSASLFIIFCGLVYHLSKIVLGLADRVTFSLHNPPADAPGSSFDPVQLDLPTTLLPATSRKLRGQDTTGPEFVALLAGFVLLLLSGGVILLSGPGFNAVRHLLENSAQIILNGTAG